MFTKTRNFVGRRVGFGRLGMPLWSLALAGVAIVAVAGQAVGPVLSGSVTGSAGLTVEQSVVLSGASVTSHGSDDNLAVINDEGTSFTAAIEMHVGDLGTANYLTLDVDNVSDADANAILELSVPNGIDIEVEDSGATDEAQMTSNTWLVMVPTGGAGSLDIRISPKDDLKPGFYTISGRIVQITG